MQPRTSSPAVSGSAAIPVNATAGGLGEQRPRSLAVAERCGVKLGCGRVAHGDLACLGRVLHLHGDDGVGAGDDQLAVPAADEEEIEVAAVDPDVHPQLDGADRGVERSQRGERVAHPPGRGAGPSGMGLAGEEEEQRVAAELDEPAAELVGDREEAAEGRAHHVGHLFGAEAALRREPLRHRGEAGHVDERHRPVQRAMALLRGVAQPLERDARQIGDDCGTARSRPESRSPVPPRARLCPPLTRNVKGRMLRTQDRLVPVLRQGGGNG